MADAPQNSQDLACLAASNTLIAWHELHLIMRLPRAPQPRCSPCILRSAAARSCSTTSDACIPGIVSVAAGMGDSVPQKPQMSFCLAGFHTASPPQATQLYLLRAAFSGAVALLWVAVWPLIHAIPEARTRRSQKAR